MPNFFTSGDFMRKQFDELDQNRDGYITEEDLKACIKGHPVHACAVNCFLKRYDADGDRRISFEEYRNGLLAYLFQNLQNEETAMSLFHLLDHDKSNSISMHELRHFFESCIGNLPKEYVGDFLNSLDANNDGEISRDEFLEFVHKNWSKRCGCCSGSQQQFMPRKMR